MKRSLLINLTLLATLTTFTLFLFLVFKRTDDFGYLFQGENILLVISFVLVVLLTIFFFVRPKTEPTFKNGDVITLNYLTEFEGVPSFGEFIVTKYLCVYRSEYYDKIFFKMISVEQARRLRVENIGKDFRIHSSRNYELIIENEKSQTEKDDFILPKVEA